MSRILYFPVSLSLLVEGGAYARDTCQALIRVLETVLFWIVKL